MPVGKHETRVSIATVDAALARWQDIAAKRVDAWSEGVGPFSAVESAETVIDRLLDRRVELERRVA